MPPPAEMLLNKKGVKISPLTFIGSEYLFIEGMRGMWFGFAHQPAWG